MNQFILRLVSMGRAEKKGFSNSVTRIAAACFSWRGHRGRADTPGDGI
jgi:hypothetical protein